MFNLEFIYIFSDIYKHFSSLQIDKYFLAIINAHLLDETFVRHF